MVLILPHAHNQLSFSPKAYLVIDCQLPLRDLLEMYHQVKGYGLFEGLLDILSEMFLRNWF